MLIKFSIQNFGSIKDKQTLSFEADESSHLENYYVIETNGLRLLKLGLIYGANASGKTTILKALQFFIDIVLKPCERKNQSLDFEPFLFDTDTPKQNTVLEVEFLQNDVHYSYEVEFCKNAIVGEVLFAKETAGKNRNKSKVFERTTDTEKQLANIVFGSRIRINQTLRETLIANTLWNNTVLGGFLKTNMELKELTDVTNWFKNYLNPVIYTKTELVGIITRLMDNCSIDKKTVLNILGKADFNLSDISINSTMRELKEKGKRTVASVEFEHSVGENSYYLPLEEESQGTQRYFSFAGLLCLLISHSTLFSVDELESSLHPDLFRHFLLSFPVNSRRSQLLATTHNREILSDKDIFRNDAIWIADKNNADCATELYSLADFDASVIRNTSNIYNAYRVGKLGGVPNLGSYYINRESGL
ncbi:MAG: ATP-binding protein [Prevotellaceae bacterium]|jgi:AAA15 family ATPase/GTPase|nr:ATP-binding protein [Prevotellaceae bacterium]